jgi:glycosyltransferase involved in cell wall biosynthesis
LKPITTWKSSLWRPLALAARFLPSRRKSVTIWGEIVDGPYGGGSQILKAVIEELRRRGFDVYNNSLHDSDAHLANSEFFDVDKCIAVIHASRKKPRVVHRIDGPISLYRGKDRHLDERIFQLNRKIATATAFQCEYSWRESGKLGFEAVGPLIIRNASDPRFFYPRSEHAPLAGRKIRLISTSWSDNMNKGFPVYKELDGLLDFSRFEYRFVGRSPVEFRNIRVSPPVASPELGDHLRWADIYITASRNDPASNSLVEALHCGLPAIYLKSGGHAEIAGQGGLGFDNAAEIPALLERIIDDYEGFVARRSFPTIQQITDQYVQALGLC